mgnify:CR=1 FL=1
MPIPKTVTGLEEAIRREEERLAALTKVINALYVLIDEAKKEGDFYVVDVCEGLIKSLRLAREYKIHKIERMRYALEFMKARR